ncbi:TolB family protein [Candidatus Bipolaricaulota bacterium]
MKKLLIVALLGLAAISVGAVEDDPLLLSVPLGIAPTLDGVLSQGEWSDALVLDVSEEVTAYLKHSGRSVYLGIRGTPFGVASPCIVRGEEVSVLHSSGSLGTAVYEISDETWSVSRSFVWECSYSRLTTAAQRCFSTYLEENGWWAPNGRMGEPTDFEFEISADGNELSMLFLFLAFEPEMQVVSWPSEAAAGPEYSELAQGYLPDSMSFDTGSWATLVLESALTEPTTYLGVPAPGLEAVPFPSEWVTGRAFAGTFNPDMTEFYCNTSMPNHDPMLGLRLVDDEWVEIPFVTEMAEEAHISPVGDRLFFTKSPTGLPTGYVSIREGDSWGEPEELPDTINGGSLHPMYITSTLDGTLYWTDLLTGSIVRSSFADGTYGRRQRVPFDLNYTGSCAHPFISPDESCLIFDREIGDAWDLYVTFRTEDGRWTPAQLIEEISSTAANEIAASISPDGRILFFARNLQMYWIDAAILDRYRP